MLHKLAILCFLVIGLSAHAEEPWQSEEHLLKASPRKVDVLFVMDASKHLATKRQQLAEQADLIIQSLQGANWQIAFTNGNMSTEGPQGMLLKLSKSGLSVITQNTPNPNLLIQGGINQSKLQHPSDHSDFKQPLTATFQAIEYSRGTENTFFRPEAELAVIYLTDEDEMKNGPWYATKPGQITHAMDVYYPNKSILTYSFTIKDNNCMKGINPDATPNTHLQRLATITRGESYDLCLADYSQPIIAMGNHMRGHINSVQLEFKPNPKNIVIHSDLNISNFVVDETKVIFPQLDLSEDAEIIIEYQKSDQIIKPK